MRFPMSEMPSEDPTNGFTRTFPSLPQPKFQLGELVRWFQVPNGDFGRVIGVIYTHEASCQTTGLHYLVLLDAQSPSREIELWLCLWRRPPTHLSTTTKFSQRKSCPRLRINCYKSTDVYVPELQLPLGGGYALAEICCYQNRPHITGLVAELSRRAGSHQKILAMADFLLANAEQVYPF